MAKITVRLIGALGVACACAAVSGESDEAVTARLQGASLPADPKPDHAMLMALRIV